MTRRNVAVQILVSEEEHEILRAVAGKYGEKLGRKGRSLLLAWADAARDAPGRVRGGRCGSSVGGGCVNQDAVWWHRVGRMFVCEACASRAPDTCGRDGGPLDELPNERLVALFDSVRSRVPGRRPGVHPRYAQLEREVRRLTAQLAKVVGDFDAVDEESLDETSPRGNGLFDRIG